jgi:hypothetical protein
LRVDIYRIRRYTDYSNSRKEVSMIYIRLKEYLGELQKEGESKSGIKLNPPTLADISRDTKIHYTTLSRMANHHAQRFDFKTADKIIKSVRGRGFDMQISDLVSYRD